MTSSSDTETIEAEIRAAELAAIAELARIKAELEAA